jgi:hypothetical protein
MSKALRLKVSDNPKGNSTLAAKISRKDAKTQRFKDKEGFKHEATEIRVFHSLTVRLCPKKI